ncbi:MAG: 50S ribosomal protein L22 [Candidatus Yanofskybacteria bacterium]|nr:50S ribosomal protein L22 [Candidatus Yanofskybacteria bacterium]
MQVSAQLKNLRISARKVRLLARAIKGMDAVGAKFQLDHIVKKSSEPLSKLLSSAIANARSSFNLAKDNLYIKEIIVNEGPKLKRFRAKGFGSASPIEKKTTHIKIVLDERVPGLKATGGESEEVAAKREEMGETDTAKEVKLEERIKFEKEKKPETKREIGKKSSVLGRVGNIKKFFRRKAI